MVFYRKYRPQTIQELDKDDVKKKLIAFIEKDSMPHAFLFSGPKGTGKTSTARILAKSLNCQSKKNGQACNACSICTAISSGTFPDVVEIDAASNRGIDEIRELREKIAYSPVQGKKKVYIIDEAHMLTREAFNALLKTLEEPPEHVLFVLATTESHKLPDTIASRCTVIPFSKATTAELTSSLHRIIKGEHLSISDELVAAIADRSDGSFRDGAKLLEQYCIEGISQEKSGNKAVSAQAFVQVVSSKSEQNILAYIENAASLGTDFTDFIVQMITQLHRDLIAPFIETANAKNTLLQKNEIMHLIRLLNRAFLETKQSPIEQLPLELAMIEWCNSK